MSYYNSASYAMAWYARDLHGGGEIVSEIYLRG